jgi:gluconokinase
MTSHQPRVIVVSGVSGSGKTTVGKLLAGRFGVAYLEGDDRHPAANVAKMSAGQPLDDGDRRPWLLDLAGWIGQQEASGRGGVVSCSALKRSYRDLLCSGHPSVWFLQLVGSPQALAQRMSTRKGHFMPPELLASQLATLEPLEVDEPGMSIDAASVPAAIVAAVIGAVGSDA